MKDQFLIRPSSFVGLYYTGFISFLYEGSQGWGSLAYSTGQRQGEGHFDAGWCYTWSDHLEKQIFLMILGDRHGKSRA
jgi:hypothetical protein